ncbi:transcription factor bHLH123-like isoform X1 [Vitis riparia]|uniref:transcription factor bHLH123-like isoform X1 n=2 Tax=Vitis riparia TaxID=96939 RepID=UPI00155ADD79|nr:transcription factor bHLH123-like isoform X1 [Vitis riparia]
MQFPEMRNAILPSFSSQYCSLGNNEIIQIPNSEVSMQMDPKVNAYSSSFIISSKAYSNQLGDGGFAMPAQTFINDDQPGTSLSSTIKRLSQPCPAADYQTSMPRYDGISQILQLEDAMQNARKRPIEAVDDLVGRKIFEEWKSSKKKKKTVSSEGQWHPQANKEAMEIQRQRLHVPVKRSQKLSDRITALQKLVSPYGKTDTASVLQEASLYIKLLQGQIRNLFQILSTSYCRVTPLHQQKIGEKEQDLQSRGLCLVPIAFTQKLTREDQVDHHQTMEQREF